MKFLKNPKTILVAAIVTTICVITFVSSKLFLGIVDSSEENQFFLLSSIVKSRLKLRENKALEIGEQIASIPRVKEFFGQRKRHELYDELKKMFSIQKEKYDVQQMHFEIPPSISFLRMNAPEKYSDNLASYKPFVTEANYDKVSKKGIALAKDGPTVYAVAPIKDINGVHAGCIEIAFGFSDILNNIKTSHNIESLLLIDKAKLTDISTSVNKGVLNNENVVGGYTKFFSTNRDLFKLLVKNDDFDISTVEPKVRKYSETYYGIYFYQLKDYNDELLGYIVLASNFNGSRSNSGKAILILFSLSLFLCTILIGFVLIVVNGNYKRPLEEINQNFNELATGNYQKEIRFHDKYSHDFRTLISFYETIRKKLLEAQKDK